MQVQVQVQVKVDQDDEAEYKRQQAHLQRQQETYRQGHMQRAEDVHGFEEKLKPLRDRCPFCHYHGFDDKHRFHECELGRAVYRSYE